MKFSVVTVQSQCSCSAVTVHSAVTVQLQCSHSAVIVQFHTGSVPTGLVGSVAVRFVEPDNASLTQSSLAASASNQNKQSEQKGMQAPTATRQHS